MIPGILASAALSRPAMAVGELYWRVLFTAPQSGAHIGITQLEMAEEPHGPNVCSGGVISASSQHDAGYHKATNAFDGKLHDFTSTNTDGHDNMSVWANAVSQFPCWLAYTFATPREIKEVRVHARKAAADLPQAPKDFQIQYSEDGIDWTTKWSVSGEPAWASQEMRRYADPAATMPAYSGTPSGAHAYWRVFVQHPELVTTTVVVGEVEFMRVDGADLVGGGTILASHDRGDVWAPPGAFDDNPAVGWASPASVPWGFIGYQFATPVTIEQFRVWCRSDSNANSSPGTSILQYSDDGVTWSSAWQQRGETGWALTERRTFIDPMYNLPYNIVLPIIEKE